MPKLKNLILTTTISSLLSINSFANENIDAELADLFGAETSSKVQIDNIDKPKDVLEDKSVTDVKSSDFVVEEITVSEKTTDSLTSMEEVPTNEITSRSDHFELALEPDAIRYTLPTFAEEVKIELLDLSGEVVDKTEHSATETGGSFDTAKLNEGYYIVRIIDSAGKVPGIARAIAIKH